MHELRRSEARGRKGTSKAAVLKGSRWALLKAPENLRPAEQVRLAEVAQINRRVYRGYLLKEELRALYVCGPLAVKHRAYGFHSAAALIAMIFLCCTKLPLTLPL